MRCHVKKDPKSSRFFHPPLRRINVVLWRWTGSKLLATRVESRRRPEAGGFDFIYESNLMFRILTLDLISDLNLNRLDVDPDFGLSDLFRFTERERGTYAQRTTHIPLCTYQSKA